MRAKSIILLVVALGCGLLASIGISEVLKNRGGKRTKGETETIFVALQDVGMGEILTPQVLRLEAWPKGKLPIGVITKIEDVEGRRTRTRLFAGEPILAKKLFGKGARNQGATMLIPKGFRVVPIQVDAVSGGADLIQPGDRVDLILYARRDLNKGVLETTTQTFLQDVKVFAVNDVTDMDIDDKSTIRAKTISLLVTPQQAEKITLATELGNLRLVMRSPEDDAVADVSGAIASDLFGSSNDASDQEKDSTLMEPEATPRQAVDFGGFLDQMPAVETYQMRIVAGNDIRDMLLEMEASHDDHDRRWRVTEETGMPTPGAPNVYSAATQSNGAFPRGNLSPSEFSPNGGRGGADGTSTPAGSGSADQGAPRAEIEDDS